MGASIELDGVGKRYLLGEHHGGGTWSSADCTLARTVASAW